MSAMDKAKADLKGWVTENEDGTRTLRLAAPFTIRGRTGKGEFEKEVTEITVRRPKAKHLDLLGEDMASVRRFASALTEHPHKTLSEELDAADGLRLVAVAVSFLAPTDADSSGGDSPET